MTDMPPEAAGREIAWETAALLRRRGRAREEAWRRALEARDETLGALTAELESARAEIRRLRSRAEEDEENALLAAFEARARLDAAREALAAAEAEAARLREELEGRRPFAQF
jgi:hypothetical protein